MGTKNNPGAFDCYANAGPDEPMFVLLARDPFAPILVRLWADLRAQAAGNPSKVAEARACADAMERFRSQQTREVAPPAADAPRAPLDEQLEYLPRYNPAENERELTSMHEDAYGEFLRYKDVQKLIADAPRAEPPQQSIESKYYELLYAVAQKFPGESRHETALRYIRMVEQQHGVGASLSVTREPK